MSALIIFIVILVVFTVVCIAYKCLENSSMARVRRDRKEIQELQFDLPPLA